MRTVLEKSIENLVLDMLGLKFLWDSQDVFEHMSLKLWGLPLNWKCSFWNHQHISSNSNHKLLHRMQKECRASKSCGWRIEFVEHQKLGKGKIRESHEDKEKEKRERDPRWTRDIQGRKGFKKVGEVNSAKKYHSGPVRIRWKPVHQDIQLLGH